jgi:glycosidase
MSTSIWEPEIQAVLERARAGAVGDGSPTAPFPSPEDWRDQWIYFLMVDRFNNPSAPPRHLPFDDPQFDQFQGGKIAGVREKLPYLKQLGVSAIWLSPVLKNCQFSQGSYHGYGIHDFLRAEPSFASDPDNADEELRELVDAAHALGIYVIFDIVLNHTGDVFAYDCVPEDTDCERSQGAEASFSATPRSVRWRDQDGTPRPDWPILENIAHPPLDATVWPSELQRNEFFRRQGKPGGDETIGDFASLKQMITKDVALQKVLIRVYQHVIAKYDVDGFRIDTLKFLDHDFALLFGNAIREFALSIGKKNFFTFGEVFDSEEKIARFIGRNAANPGDLVGVDAALDFPLVFTLPAVIKGFAAPATVVRMYEARKRIERGVLSSHGEATRFFVTFLDNHDLKQRFYFSPPVDPHRYDDQVYLALACLFSLQGIPCVYYGTEQGLHGAGTNDAAVREALWGKKPNGFDADAPFYRALQAIAGVRNQQPALRYGRQYFRPISGDGSTFGVSPFAPGVLAFSRILNDEEVVVVANADPNRDQSILVIVDFALNPAGAAYKILYSNKATPKAPGAVGERAKGTVAVQEVDGTSSDGPIHIIKASLQPLEVQILTREPGVDGL